MGIPKNVSGGKKKGVSSGKRLNSKPTFIVVAIVGATLYGIYYAASNRAQGPKVAAESTGEEMLQVDANPKAQIEFLQDRPDGLAGVNSDLFKAKEDDEKKRISTLDDRMLDAYEQRQLDELKKQNDLRDRMIQRQIEQAQSAIEGGIDVDGFQHGSEFINARRQRKEAEEKERMRYTEVNASAQGAPFNLIGQQLPSNTNPSTMSAEDLQRIAAQLPPEYQQLLQRLLTNPTAGVTDIPLSSGSDTTGVDASNQYLERNKRDFTLREKVESPRTRFEIKTGTVIPGAMISASNSDLPGDIVGQVTQNVYDTQTGRYLLIPQGTKLFGRYDAFTQLGQERLLIVWDRLIFPDAETLDIGGMQGYDGFGQAGSKDKVNTHFVRTLFNALLVSLVSASGEALTSAASEIDDSFVLNLSASFGETASRPFDEYLRNRLKIKPTLTIRSGYRFNIMVSKDISLDSPYRYGYKLKLARP